MRRPLKRANLATEGDFLRDSLSTWAALAAVCSTVAGCSQTAGSTTASVAAAPAAVVNTPASRLEHLAWNSAWAKSCGFYFDNAKLKSSYLAYETAAGTPAEQVAKLGNSFDRLQGSIGSIAASQADQCTDRRLEHIRAEIARYLGGDFTPGESV